DARDEGGVKGRNNKGLVTLDRTIKKDAFYIYKAYWSREPFVHICGRRFARRTGDFLSVKVYSNLPDVTLFLDGIRIADRMGDKVFEFQEIPWTEGIHFVRAVGQDCEDCITLERVTEPWEPYILVDEEAAQGDGAANWFTNLIVETPPEMTFDPQYFSVKDRIRELLGCNEAMEAVVGAMYS
ncbi:beta-galactosidase, partial [Anaerotignum faecicola]|nr:beta-galactosidase [Anaerotignum faecicola]